MDMDAIRSYRNTLLKDSDWTQFNDSPLTEEQKDKWKVYRQTLRDITEDLTNVAWPNQPGAFISSLE